MAGRLAHGLSRENLRVDAPSAPTYGRASSDAVRPAMLGRAFGSTPDTADVPSGSRRLAFFERDWSTSAATLLPPRAHSRADTAMSPAGSVLRDMAASPDPGQISRAHVSPSSSKTAASARTYDSKSVSREMYRLGNITHLPNALAPALGSAAAASASTLTLPQPTLTVAPPAALPLDDPWRSMHMYLLPMFNGEPLRVPIEELNRLVRRHIGTVISTSPSKALSKLETDVSDILNLGMVTLNGKLTGLEDDKLVSRVVETWGFFWDQVLTYVEGSLLPMQTDPLLQSLYRKARRPSSPSRGGVGSSTAAGGVSTLASAHASPQIDVRTLALRAFRDKVILPVSKALGAFFSIPRQDYLARHSEYEQSRLQQMLLVLVSQARSPPPSLSLTEPPPTPSPGEQAVQHLLRALRSPGMSTSPRQPRAPSFLSSKTPRDRRGRIASRGDGLGSGMNGFHLGVALKEEEGEETPRNGMVGMLGAQERELDREFLERLRSPTNPDQETNVRSGQGGWGLDGGGDEAPKRYEDDDDEHLEMDQAQLQAHVERMVGMEPHEQALPEPMKTRRRMT